MSDLSPNQFDLGTVIDDAKRLITNPVEFYRTMPQDGGYANPLIFAVVVAAVTGIAIAILSLVGLGSGSMAFAGIAGFTAIIIFPVMAVIGTFVGGAIMFVIWKLMGSEKSYETAYRCVAYSYAIMPLVLLVSIIPYVGTIVKTLWGLFLMYTASIEVHEIKAQTAKIVMGVLAALGLLFGISSERTARHYQKNFSQYEDKFGKALEDIDDMTAEEAGREFGKFLKGMEKFAEGLEEETKKKADDEQD